MMCANALIMRNSISEDARERENQREESDLTRPSHVFFRVSL